MEEHNSTHTLLSAQMKNLNVRLLLNLIFYGLKAGADPGFFFTRGCTPLLLYFNTNKPHSFFFGRIPVVLENRASSLHPSPRSAPVWCILTDTKVQKTFQGFLFCA